MVQKNILETVREIVNQEQRQLSGRAWYLAGELRRAADLSLVELTGARLQAYLKEVPDSPLRSYLPALFQLAREGQPEWVSLLHSRKGHASPYEDSLYRGVKARFVGRTTVEYGDGPRWVRAKAPVYEVPELGGLFAYVRRGSTYGLDGFLDHPVQPDEVTFF